MRIESAVNLAGERKGQLIRSSIYGEPNGKKCFG